MEYINNVRYLTSYISLEAMVGTAATAIDMSTGVVPIPKDEELVSRIKEGDTQALNILARVHLPKTYRKVRRLVPLEDAEDVTQDIFLNLTRSIDNFEGRSAFATWFNKIVVNRVADYHRRMFRQRSRFTSEEGYEQTHEPDTSDMEMEDILMSVPKHYREVLLLKFQEGMSFAEIALALGMTYEAARSRLRRAVDYVRDREIFLD